MLAYTHSTARVHVDSVSSSLKKLVVISEFALACHRPTFYCYVTYLLTINGSLHSPSSTCSRCRMEVAGPIRMLKSSLMATYSTPTQCVWYVSVKFNGGRSIVVVAVVESDESFTESNWNDRFRLNPAIGRIRRGNSLWLSLCTIRSCLRLSLSCLCR